MVEALASMKANAHSGIFWKGRDRKFFRRKIGVRKVQIQRGQDGEVTSTSSCDLATTKWRVKWSIS
jgi:hypothetical protein